MCGFAVLVIGIKNSSIASTKKIEARTVEGGGAPL
jgi:hypothetical protein